MSVALYKNESRGRGNYDWLKTKYSYSFSNYYDLDRMSFGALRVVNDDWIAPGSGFPTHGHQNMEIITIPLVGTLAHKDDAGGEGEVKVGDVQVMSAGTGVLHSEFNGSATEPVELFQIWIEPNKYHAAPRYQENQYRYEQGTTGHTLLVGPEGKCDSWVHQDAYVSRINVLEGEEYQYPLYNPKNGVYLLVIAGEGKILGYDLQKRDGLEVTHEERVIIRATQSMDILCIEVPLG